MQKTSEVPTYIDKVKVVLFSNVEDLFHKEKTTLFPAQTVTSLATPSSESSVSTFKEVSSEGEHLRSGSAIQTGTQKRTFLREVRLKKTQPVSQKQQKNRSSFWQSILDKAQTSNDQKTRAAKTDVSVELGGWINLPYGIHTTLALVLEYFDGDTHCSFKIDSCESKGAIQVLLSGSCDIIADCPVDTVKLYCYGIEDKSVWIENLSFECKG